MFSFSLFNAFCRSVIACVYWVAVVWDCRCSHPYHTYCAWHGCTHVGSTFELFSMFLTGQGFRLVARRTDGPHLLHRRICTGGVRGRAKILVFHAQLGWLSHYLWSLVARWSKGRQIQRITFIHRDIASVRNNTRAMCLHRLVTLLQCTEIDSIKRHSKNGENLVWNRNKAFHIIT